MRWDRGRRSSGDVIDARGRSGGRGRGATVAGGGGALGILVVLLVTLLGGGSGNFQVPGLDGAGGVPVAGPSDAIPADQDPEKDLKDFSAYVFDDVQAFWSGRFAKAGAPYTRAKLVLFRSGVNTRCGSASSAVGPFYCPADRRAYIDLSFYGDMQRQLGASGDFAWAYVIAHEVAHHIQNELGTNRQVDRLGRDEPDQRNELSVRQELQADCYAGVWGRTVFKAGDLERGDLEEALGAAQAVGDDRLQSRGGGDVKPDSFTHGTSAQRERWFRAGFDSGDPARCDTFGADEL